MFHLLLSPENGGNILFRNDSRFSLSLTALYVMRIIPIQLALKQNVVCGETQAQNSIERIVKTRENLEGKLDKENCSVSSLVTSNKIPFFFFQLCWTSAWLVPKLTATSHITLKASCSSRQLSRKLNLMMCSRSS
jgi:hypothetical protein